MTPHDALIVAQAKYPGDKDRQLVYLATMVAGLDKNVSTGYARAGIAYVPPKERKPAVLIKGEL